MNVGLTVVNEKIKEESVFVEELTSEINKVIVGQSYLIDRLLIGLLADGHILIEGVPGLAKTTAVKTLADAIQTNFQRIQFTPDLLPADVMGTMIYHEGTFEVKKGPIFSNLILADEINRAPAKVQSALLEAMQERQVTIGEETFKLDAPFMVLATQNPIEQEGTYPLPEAQVDRFMLKLKVTYPSKEEERLILDRMTTGRAISVKSVITPTKILAVRSLIHEIYIDDKIKDYIINLVFASRQPEEYELADLKDLIAYGGSPRASIYLTVAARAHAFLRGRGYVVPDDIKAIAHDILRHRIIPTYEAEAENITSEDIIQQILDHIEVP